MAITLDEKYDYEDDLPQYTKLASRSRNRQLIAALATACSIALLITHGGGCVHSLMKNEKHSSPVKWVPCAADSAFQCGYLEVPKDYHNTSAGSAHIAMARMPASAKHKHKRLGTIFLNPGGPGGSGVGFALGYGRGLHDLLDGRYDILGFDPRGIGSTRPRVECFNSTLDYELFKAGTVLERGFDVPADPYSTEGRLHLLEQHRQLLALQQAEFEKCRDSMGDEIRHMGTATVVRDIERMSHVLDGPEAKISYFGTSYGTILGAFLVNMLPAHKIGRVVIDGVASAPEWANKFSVDWLHDWIVDTETTFKWFLRDCSEAGPKLCPVAKERGEDPAKIGDRLLAYVENLYEKPIAVPHANRPGILTAGAARTVLYASTNQPRAWPHVADIFAQALAGDPTALYNEIVKPFSLRGVGQTDLSRAAVACADSPAYTDEKDWPTAERMLNKTLYDLESSPHFGASVHIVEPDGGCQFHPASGRAPERSTGPFNSTLDEPMLIISNTADPITPLASGRELNKLMGPSSRLLIQNSPGHCSVGSVSTCTRGHFRRYFLTGDLPEDETVCEIDRGYFPDPESAESDDTWMASNEDDELKRMSVSLAQAWNDYVVRFDQTDAAFEHITTSV